MDAFKAMIYKDGMPHDELESRIQGLSYCHGHLQFECMIEVSSGSVEVFVCDYCGERFANLWDKKACISFFGRLIKRMFG